MRLARSQSLLNVVGAGTTEDDNIKEGVGTETVSTMDRDASSFTSGIETRNNFVFATLNRKLGGTQRKRERVDRTSSTVSTSPVYLVGIPPTEKAFRLS